MSAISLILISLVALSSAKVYKPCELAQDIYEIIMDKAKTTIDYPDHPFAKATVQYLQDIPLLVCIAGYQNYTTDTSYTLGDGIRREGIFGVVADAGTGESYVDDDITDDLWTFFSGALYIGFQKNTIAHNFYNHACIVNNNARPVYCYLNKYVFGSFPVLVPKKQQNLRMMYQTPQRN